MNLVVILPLWLVLLALPFVYAVRLSAWLVRLALRAVVATVQLVRR